ncbi:hypothetical protein J6590_065959 [Homalodisca vitripennis]|nr:hypothetical protein J6590_065959 [Homalodisca vitripennis]
MCIIIISKDLIRTRLRGEFLDVKKYGRLVSGNPSYHFRLAYTIRLNLLWAAKTGVSLKSGQTHESRCGTSIVHVIKLPEAFLTYFLRGGQWVHGPGLGPTVRLTGFKGVDKGSSSHTAALEWMFRDLNSISAK